jgi:hypothetical protein
MGKNTSLILSSSSIQRAPLLPVGLRLIPVGLRLIPVGSWSTGIKCFPVVKGLVVDP